MMTQLKLILNRIHIKIIFLIIISSLFNYCFGKNVVLFLDGTGSAGKTSLSKSIEAQLKKEKKRVQFIEWDDIALEVIKETIKKRKTTLNLNIPSSIIFQNFLQKFGSNSLEMLLEDIKKSIIKKANNFLSIDNSILIIDMVSATQNSFKTIQTSFENNPLILNILIYCSLPALLDHVIARNNLNILTEKRDILYTLEHHFMKMYKPQYDNSKEKIDSIKALEFKKFFLKAKSNSKNSGLDNEEIIKKFDSACNRFMNQFGLIENDNVNIAPNFSYDFLVNNSSQTSEKSAVQIKDFLLSQCS